MTDVNMDEIEAVRESIAEVLADQCDSRALHTFYNGAGDLAASLRGQALQLGWLAIALPEAAGGLGLGAHGAVVLHQELGRAAAPGDLAADAIALDVLAAHAGTDPLIGAVMAGDARIAVAARPGDPARREFLGDPRANYALAPHGADGMALFDLAGLEPVIVNQWDLTRQMFELSVGDLTPFAIMPGLRAVFENALALALAADSLGACEAIADRTLAYMKERQQFGRPIASFQALKHRMADIYKGLSVARHLLAQAADSGAVGGPVAALWTAQAKASVTEFGAFVTAEAVQLHGGVGFTWEYDPHIYLKRARLNEAMLDDNGALRDRAFAALQQAIAADIDVLELAL